VIVIDGLRINPLIISRALGPIFFVAFVSLFPAISVQLNQSRAVLLVSEYRQYGPITSIAKLCRSFYDWPMFPQCYPLTDSLGASAGNRIPVSAQLFTCIPHPSDLRVLPWLPNKRGGGYTSSKYPYVL